jgi:hypothetical protein
MTMESHEKAVGCMQAYNGRAPPNVTGWALDIDWASEAVPNHQGEPTVSANSETCQACTVALLNIVPLGSEFGGRNA